MADGPIPATGDFKRAWVAYRVASAEGLGATPDEGAFEEEFDRWFVASSAAAVAAYVTEKNDTPFLADCWTCAQASADRLKARGDFAASVSFRMYVCPECGDKRCAKATDHHNGCDAVDRATETS